MMGTILIVAMCLMVYTGTVSTSGHVSPFLDMSYSFKTNETIYWPTAEHFVLTNVFAAETEHGVYYEINDYCAAEHGGTHIDAPAHFFEGRHRVHEIPLDTFIGPVIRIDIKAKADINPDAELTISDLEAWEDTYGRIPDDVILLMYSGWGSRWPDKLTYLGTETRNTSLLHFPGIHPDAAQWLVDNRKVKAVGVDTPSLDNGQSTTFLTHRILFEKNIPGLENVANLDQIPNIGATFYAVPIGLYDGSGSPTRMFATGWRSDIPEPCNIAPSQTGSMSPFLDLSYQFKENETIYASTFTPYDQEIVLRGTTDSGYYYEANNFCACEHGGTHMDAPSHFARGKLKAHEITLDTLIGPAIKVDIKSKADEDPQAELEVDDLLAWEVVNGRIPDDVILMVYSDWGSRWPDKERYLGTTTTNMSLYSFPGIHPEAAKWLVNNRKIKCVGIDTPSLDNGKSILYESHQTLLGNNIPGLENVANLDRLPTTGATVFALPMKIYGGSGGPARVFATGWRSDIPDPCSTVGGSSPTYYSVVVLLLATISTIYSMLRA